MKDVDAIKSELTEIAREWRSVCVRYVGPAPLDAITPDLWHEATLLPYWAKAEADTELDFAHAWHEAVKRVRELFWGRLQPWACNLIRVCPAVFQFESTPDPPAEIVPVPGSNQGSRLAWVTGTNDLIQAGERVVFWCLADLNPPAMRRPFEHRILFHRWTSKVLTFSDDTIQPTEDVIMAVVAATDRMLTSAMQTSESSEHFAEFVETKPMVRQLDKAQYAFHYEGEMTVLRDKTVERIVRLLREKRVSVMELAHGPLKGHDRPSIAPGENGALSAKRIPEIEEIDEELRPRFVAELKDKREANNLALQQIKDDNQRAEIEQENLIITKILNGLHRIPKNDEGKGREKLKKGFDRLWANLPGKGCPAMSEHFRQHVRLTSDKSAYEYTGNLDWDFLEMS